MWRCSGFTHHAWSRIGDPALVGPPLLVGALLVSEGSVEGFSDVSHAVNAHGKTLEHITVEARGGNINTNDCIMCATTDTGGLSYISRKHELERKNELTLAYNQAPLTGDATVTLQ